MGIFFLINIFMQLLLNSFEWSTYCSGPLWIRFAQALSPHASTQEGPLGSQRPHGWIDKVWRYRSYLLVTAGFLISSLMITWFSLSYINISGYLEFLVPTTYSVPWANYLTSLNLYVRIKYIQISDHILPITVSQIYDPCYNYLPWTYLTTLLKWMREVLLQWMVTDLNNPAPWTSRWTYPLGQNSQGIPMGGLFPAPQCLQEWPWVPLVGPGLCQR